ncbi:helix-turn-helix domain-containing protein [Ktedonosporobacter rubrisoli]|uniref:Helix-turn-helix domain-containing protein n=1 Tax=Ktedonosporobacter rubrisoli TaxID=2509675 RepID=A0A4P6JI83_KTERU|nr:helix-turn-helix domain-containing protein [Ktedonosporobacter rubrisoli]QBD74590.1 helix-turn-helix domain-containing protein [Ktedonosporobacter rubrisoli]
MARVVHKERLFGTWLREQRRKRYLTQAELAQHTNCATITIRKIEANERRPSKELAELLADCLEIAPQSRSTFLEFARAGSLAAQMPIINVGEQRNKGERVSPWLVQGQTPFLVHSASAYLLDARSDRLLLDLHGEELLPIASTTKIMTSLIAIEQADLQQDVTIKHETIELIKRYGGNCTRLNVDDQLSVWDLLYAMLLPSGDDAALVVAESVAGNMREFVKLMNHYARRLHLKNTHFVNPSGTPYLGSNEFAAHDNYSTAADLAHLTLYALANPLFAQIVQLQRYTLPATSMHQAYSWETTNTLLGSYAGTTGVKTGYTPEAGACFVFSATSSKQHLLGTLLQCKEMKHRYIDATKLLDWGFARQRGQ